MTRRPSGIEHPGFALTYLRDQKYRETADYLAYKAKYVDLTQDLSEALAKHLGVAASPAYLECIHFRAVFTLPGDWRVAPLDLDQMLALGYHCGLPQQQDFADRYVLLTDALMHHLSALYNVRLLSMPSCFNTHFEIFAIFEGEETPTAYREKLNHMAPEARRREAFRPLDGMQITKSAIWPTLSSKLDQPIREHIIAISDPNEEFDICNRIGDGLEAIAADPKHKTWYEEENTGDRAEGGGGHYRLANATAAMQADIIALFETYGFAIKEVKRVWNRWSGRPRQDICPSLMATYSSEGYYIYAEIGARSRKKWEFREDHQRTILLDPDGISLTSPVMDIELHIFEDHEDLLDFMKSEHDGCLPEDIKNEESAGEEREDKYEGALL